MSHWVGRGHLLSAVVLARVGLFLVRTRSAPANPVVFAGLALRAAIARRIEAHRRWALHPYPAVLGVWFFRLGLTLWLLVHQAPVGFDPKTFSGPFLIVLTLAQSLVPAAGTGTAWSMLWREYL